MSGFVSLVGAGPGNPELLTLLGKRRLIEADVVLYDRLVNPAVLMVTSAEKIDVGKLPHHHTYSQYKINELLLTLANQGKRVVRLKAGDPYVFGRGGEESQYLKAHHVDYEVIPGITSAIAGLGAVGIPITHRDFSSSFHIITGHQKKAGEELDWQNIAHQEGTLVFLMGMEQLATISDRLVENGMARTTPVALIQWATHWQQRSALATLADVAQVAVDKQIGSPALIVVGRVATLMKTLQPHPPLFGWHILIPYKKESRLFRVLQDAGASVGFFKRGALRALSVQMPEQTKAATLFINDINAYQYFQKQLLAQHLDQRWLAGWHLVAKDRVVANHLEAFGLIVDEVIADPQNLVDPAYVLGEKQQIAGLAANQTVTPLATYEQLPIEQTIDFADYRAAVFPSSTVVTELIRDLDQTQLAALKSLKCVAMGEKAATACRQAGLQRVIVAKPTYQAVREVLKGVK